LNLFSLPHSWIFMLLIADNLTVTNKAVQSAVAEKNPEPIRELVRNCVAAGAQAIDINPGPLGRNPESTMTFLVDTVQAVTNLPVLIDTPNPRAIEAALRYCKHKAIINGFSLEPAKLEAVLPLAKEYNVDIIGYLLRPDGHVPADAQERLQIAFSVYEALCTAGIDRERLIIDPIVVPVTWHNGNLQNREVLSVIRQLPDLLAFPVRTIAGLSNLTATEGPREKKLLIESAYVCMLAEAGLSMVLMNMLHKETVAAAKACRSLLHSGIFALEEI
jgi:5-methyltetrahydrofolate corrinoid/iron sulfur protein methyltransferase